MPRQTLKILAEIDIPDVNECFNFRTLRSTPDCLMPGFFIETINLIASRLDLQVQFISADEFANMYFRNTNETDPSDLILEHLRNATFDLISTYVDNSSAYGGDFIVTAPVYLSETKYILARSQVLTGLFSFLTVYDIYLWLGIFGTFLLVALASSTIYGLRPNNAINNRENIGNIIWKLIRLELMQYQPIQERLLSLNLIIFIFALFNCVLLVQMYNSVVTTQVVREIDPRPFKEAEIFQVLKERRYSLIFKSKFNWWQEKIFNSTASPFFELRQALSNNPVRMALGENGADNLNEYLMQQIDRSNLITIMTDERSTAMKYKGYCNFLAFSTGFPPKTAHLLMRRGHPLLGKINKVILDDIVFLRRLHDKYYKHGGPSKCDEIKKGPTALGLTPYFGILILLAGGASAGIVALFIELWINKRFK